MEQYIDKDAVLAEIERRIKTNKECMLGLRNLDYYQGKVDALNDTISSLNTLEVKGVNLENLREELDKAVKIYKPNGDFGWGTLYNIAVHFFELGLRASNPLTYEDIEMIGKLRLKVALDLRNKELESSINNPIKFTEEDFCKEVLKRFKAQKGEKV